MASLEREVSAGSTDDPRELERADQQRILDNLPAMIAYWDKNLRNRLANRVYVDYFGMTPEQIFGRHISEVLGEDLYRQNLPYLEKALAGERQEFDREIPTPSGPRYTQALYLPDVSEGEVRGIFVLVTDISARRVAELALANAESRFRTLFEAAPSATLMSDERGTIVAANHAAAAMFGYPVAELEGMTGTRLLVPEDVASAGDVRRELFSGQRERLSEERRYRHADGHEIWAQAEITVVRGGGGSDQELYALAQLQDITARKSYERELEHVATHDALTGVLNRRGLTQELEKQARAAASGGPAGAVLVCDLDRFKDVNDLLGHDAGDELLVRVARVIEQSVRATDVVGRLGGDEFAVILPTEDLAGARTVADKIARRLATSHTGTRWAGIDVGISIGLAVFAPDATYDETLRAADAAMFAVKQSSRTERRRGR